jgi:nicotinate-nucleotide pyrophosphorylase (carboxylating)
MTKLPHEAMHAETIDQIARRALVEDLADEHMALSRDITSHWIVAAEAISGARIVARQKGVIAGIDLARAVFHQVDGEIDFAAVVEDGARVQPEESVVTLKGSTRSLLTAERTALNFLQHLSGVATLTRTFVEAISGTGATITDTRKTTPGLRVPEKQAVRTGGGVNHRFGLYDAVLIKDNHAEAVGGAGRAVELARAATAGMGSAVPVYAEARDLTEVRALLDAGPDRIMLDNMAIDSMRQAVGMIRDAAGTSVQIEATGGIALDKVRAVAETGVDLISVGALTHSAPALDLSLLVEPGSTRQSGI